MNKRKKHVWLRVVLGVVVVLIVAVGGAAYWQRSNIQAYLNSRKYSTEELEQMLGDSETRAAEILEKLPQVSIRPLTPDELDKIKSGEMSESEVAAAMVRPPVVTPREPTATTSGENINVTATPSNEASTQSPTVPELSETEQQIAEKVARIYVLRDMMSSKIGEILESGRNELNSYPAEERTKEKKQEIMLRYATKLDELEGSCDSQFERILKELETLLKESGGDLGVIAEIRQAYVDEKIVKKSYYISKYS